MISHSSGNLRRPESFRRTDRITDGRDFKRVQSLGKRRTGSAFSIQLVAAQDQSRLGLAVGRRIGSAVVRNRAKRLIREWFRRQRAMFPTELDLVVIARSSAAADSLAAISRELATLVQAQGVS